MNKLQKTLATTGVVLLGGITGAAAECDFQTEDGQHRGHSRMAASGAFKGCAIQTGFLGWKNGQDATGKIRCKGNSCDASSGTFSYNHKTFVTTVKTSDGETFRVSVRGSATASMARRFDAQAAGVDTSKGCTRTTTRGLPAADYVAKCN